MIEIVWLEIAADEFEDAIAWIRERNDNAADKMAETALFQIDQLKHYPQLGRVGRDNSTRELVISNTHFIVVYRVIAAKQSLEILSFKHDAMRWPAEF
ncbi:MAG: type II toxin-antitoxin system RelE/ParE family toxin [Bdellovibrio sp.]|nr:type II toxin-antitoxin system RelE/ParE family toxin [Methylotenera sp.]